MAHWHIHYGLDLIKSLIVGKVSQTHSSSTSVEGLPALHVILTLAGTGHGYWPCQSKITFLKHLEMHLIQHPGTLDQSAN